MRSFASSRGGSVTLQFGLAALLLTGLVGGSLDFARAVRVRSYLQSALDQAVLASARDGTENWSAVATRGFSANIDPTILGGSTPAFSIDSAGMVSGTITTELPTTLMQAVGFSKLQVSARSAALAAHRLDNSCLLTLDHGARLSDDAITFNGAPNLDFSKCTIRSNASMQCNGHGGGSVHSISAGFAQGCSNPQSNAAVVPDIYAPLASNISRVCGSARPGGIWMLGKPPVGIVPVHQPGYSEFHVCGDLILSGVGYLTGPTPASDTVIVVENGGITLAAISAISTRRVTFILTGNNGYASSLSFPNGAGKAASLALSPATDPSDPWRGISLYQDPDLTNAVDEDWGSDTAIAVDGVVYLPNSNVTISGSATSNIDDCTKIVANTLKTNGSVALRFAQSAGCTTLGVDQWTDTSVYLTR